MPKKYKVKEGDCIASIAFDNDLFPETIWNDTANAALKKTRENPNVLAVGDIVVIPDKVVQIVDCASDNKHQFLRKGVPEKLTMRFLDEAGGPRIGVKYRLDIDGELRQGTTGSRGEIEHVIPPNARQGKLYLDEGEAEELLMLDIGTLPPLSETLGVQKRLSNLRFECLEDDGVFGEKTEIALKAFQAHYELPVTGEVDTDTKNKLAELHEA
jgi:hypothetical protein